MPAGQVLMVVTDNFVYLHSPKSGGTFVTEMLLAVASRVNGFSAINLTDLKHSGVRSIPDKYRHLQVVMNRRNIFSHYVSRYNYRWWTSEKRARKTLDVDRVKADYPLFPELSFSEYLRFVNHWPYRSNFSNKIQSRLEEREIGYNTWEFVRLTQQNPMATLRTFDNIPAGQLREQYSDIRFLRTELLNEDLVALLVESGIAGQELAFILENKAIIPRPGERLSIEAWLGYLSSRVPRKFTAPAQERVARKATCWLEYYSAADLEFVSCRDRFYFTLFPEMQRVHTGETSD